jgi:hypothetical protein
MDAISVRDRMIDGELRQRAMAQASQRSHGEPGVRQTVRAFGRLLVRLGKVLIAEGCKLETYELPAPPVNAPQEWAR